MLLTTPLPTDHKASEQPAVSHHDIGWHLPIPVVCTNAGLTIQWVNQAFEQCVGVNAENVLGHPLTEFLSPIHAELLAYHLHSLEKGHPAAQRLWVRWRCASGKEILVNLRSQKWMASDGTPQGWVHTIHPLEDQETLPSGQQELLSELFVQGWVQVLHARDLETSAHTHRVARLTTVIGTALGIPSKDLRNWRWGALLHDIGKIAIPDEILRKPGPLTEEEWQIMRQHPLLAQAILRDVPFLPEDVLTIPLYHHERCDGSGYPFGLRCEQIPLPARAFAVVDVWDALSRERPYRRAWPPERIWQYLKQHTGTLFDPLIVQTFERLYLDGLPVS